MLGKLIKHEFHATSRIMLPVLLILLATSVGGNISARILGNTDNYFLITLAGLMLAAFVIMLIASGIVAMVLMINRFRTNLLGDEGYVMFTLPTSVHEQVWSKLIVATVWFIATAIAVCLAIFILVFRVSYVTEFFANFQGLFDQLTGYYAANGIAYFFEILLFLLVSCFSSCLIFYASMAVGYSFPNHKLLLSVAFFFVFNFAIQIVDTMGLFAIVATDGIFDLTSIESTVVALHAINWTGILYSLVLSAIFYVITTFMLKKRLNLE